jgi:hypothetical protein
MINALIFRVVTSPCTKRGRYRKARPHSKDTAQARGRLNAA